MNIKKVLITGAEGFIAHYLVKKLKKNKKFKVFGSFYKKSLINDTKAKFYKCDVRNLNSVKNLIKKIKPDIIFHLAAKSHPTYSFTNPVETMQTNVIGTINILESCKLLSLTPKIIVACSSAQYGIRNFKLLPMKENDAYYPEHIYGLSKVFQEMLGLQYYKMFDLKVVNAIIFNTSGPRKKFDVFFDICKQFSTQMNKKKIEINCGNLNNYRDFMHVEDVADALITIANKGKVGQCYNIGSSKLIKVSKIIQILEKSYEKKIILRIDKKLIRKYDEKYISSSNKKIKKLGWRPKKNIKDIITDMIDYTKNSK